MNNASNQVNVLLSGPGVKAIKSESVKTFAGKDAEQYLQFLQQKFGILPIFDLGNKLDDCFFRLKRLIGETMARWSIGSDRLDHRLLSAHERAPGRTIKSNVCDSAAQTKPDDEVKEIETVEEFDNTPSVGTARSRPRSTQARSIQSGRTVMSLRILEEFGMINIPRSHLAPSKKIRFKIRTVNEVGMKYEHLKRERVSYNDRTEHSMELTSSNPRQH